MEVGKIVFHQGSAINKKFTVGDMRIKEIRKKEGPRDKIVHRPYKYFNRKKNEYEWRIDVSLHTITTHLAKTKAEILEIFEKLRLEK